jgi:hypothetical protein
MLKSHPTWHRPVGTAYNATPHFDAELKWGDLPIVLVDKYRAKV